MGYSGGYTSDPAYTVQKSLANRWDASPPAIISQNVVSALSSMPITLTPTFNFDTFLKQYGESTSLPQTIDQFTASLVSYFGLTQADGQTLKTALRNSIASSLSLATLDQSAIAAALNDPALSPNSATFYNDVYDSAFNKFLQGFDYNTAAEDGTSPTVVSGADVVNLGFFNSKFQDYFFKFASIVQNTASPSVNFQDIYEGFFGSNSGQFTTFLANYINKSLYSTVGGSFVPNEEIGAFLKKVQESYSIAIYGSAAPTTSSVGESFKKVVVIDQVLRMIISIIGTLQKVAAMQSDRLRVLTLQQSAYTTLMSQIPVFTSGDGTIFSLTGVSADEAQKARDQGNNFNQALTETVRSKRTTVQDDAKLMQNNVTQSNDSANDQAGTATSLLQTLSSLLAAILK